MIKISQKASIIIGLSILSLMVSLDTKAAIYKCVNLNDEVFYKDKPCPKNAVERKIKAVKDPVGGYIAPTTFEKEKENTAQKFIVIGKEDSNNNSSLGSDNTENKNFDLNTDSSNDSAEKSNYNNASTSNSISSSSNRDVNNGLKTSKKKLIRVQNPNNPNNVH